MRLSQGQLNLLERCPRQFQHTYLEQLASPAHPEQHQKQTWGSQFHLLMQQRELGLPIESLVQEDAQLQRWMTAFTNAAPEILTLDTNKKTFRESEHCRTLQVQDYLLTVIYDLLIADDAYDKDFGLRTAQILDWKTYPKPQNRNKLGQNWQTLLYLYVLAETSDYLPEQMSITYWFVQSEDKPQSLKFTYNNIQHQKTGEKLHRLLSKLTYWLQRYEEGEQFPQVNEGSDRCVSCQFTIKCDRTTSASDSVLPENADTSTDKLLDIATIQEVVI